MFIIYNTKIQTIYQICKFLGVFFIKNESFFSRKRVSLPTHPKLNKTILLIANNIQFPNRKST